MTIRGEQLRQAVLEPVAGLVRKRKIVGIGADTDDAVRRTLAAGDKREDDDESEPRLQCPPPIENT